MKFSHRNVLKVCEFKDDVVRFDCEYEALFFHYIDQAKKFSELNEKQKKYFQEWIALVLSERTIAFLTCMKSGLNHMKHNLFDVLPESEKTDGDWNIIQNQFNQAALFSAKITFSHVPEILTLIKKLQNHNENKKPFSEIIHLPKNQEIILNAVAKNSNELFFLFKKHTKEYTYFTPSGLMSRVYDQQTRKLRVKDDFITQTDLQSECLFLPKEPYMNIFNFDCHVDTNIDKRAISDEKKKQFAYMASIFFAFYPIVKYVKDIDDRSNITRKNVSKFAQNYTGWFEVMTHSMNNEYKVFKDIFNQDDYQENHKFVKDFFQEYEQFTKHTNPNLYLKINDDFKTIVKKYG